MSSSPFSTLSFRRLVVSNAMVSPCMSYAMKPLTALPSVGRRQFLFFLTATTAFTVREATSVAQDIPLFGIRKSLKKAEEEVEEIVKEGFEAADKGLVATEKGRSGNGEQEGQGARHKQHQRLRRARKPQEDEGLAGPSKPNDKKDVFWAPVPLTSKSWADVDDEDDDDYYATIAPPESVWAAPIITQNDITATKISFFYLPYFFPPSL
ncbi:hypothetical protein JHK87_016151 [Glycine soja]|nr:hypothetical protein JHK87_016151 [Glycine soja]